MYQIVIKKKAKKFIDRLPLNEKKRVVAAIERLPNGEDIKKLKGHADLLRLRVGEYRIIYTVDHGELIVQTTEVRFTTGIDRQRPQGKTPLRPRIMCICVAFSLRPAECPRIIRGMFADRPADSVPLSHTKSVLAAAGCGSVPCYISFSDSSRARRSTIPK